MPGTSVKIESNLDVEYRLEFQDNLLDPENPKLARGIDGEPVSGTRLVVIDQGVWDFYQKEIEHYFESNNVSVHFMLLSGDEESKHFEHVLNICSELNALGTNRRSCPPIVIGGGVVIDTLATAASLYRRGIPYVRVATTLLGLVDVSVAAKTAINYEGFRNRLGAYYPPPLSFIDKTFIKTQDRRHISNGLAEIFKLALIKDARLFELLEQNGRDLIETKFQGSSAADEVIYRAIDGMATELESNLWERDLKRCVDFGHSFSPLIEMNELPALYHGEAVCLDCLLSTALSVHRGLCDLNDLKRAIACARSLDLPVVHDAFCDTSRLLESLEDTVRHRDGNQNLPVIAGIGSYVFLNDVKEADLKAAIHIWRDHA